MYNINSKQIKKFYQMISVDDDGCFIYNGTRKRNGVYLHQWSHKKGKQTEAPIARLMYFLKKGPVERKQYVRHKCGNPRCVNMNHLYIVGKNE